jgi:RNA polymerase sigma factor (TIGR02999 family)
MSECVSELIRRLREGNRSALDELVPLMYSELRKVASAYLRNEKVGHTLQPTALINEVYLRLAGAEHHDILNRTHFLGVAAFLMRQILTEHARRRNAAKRGLGVTVVALNEGIDFSPERAAIVIALDDALTGLAAIDSEQARFVELRFYSGMTADEIATFTGVSVHRVRHRTRTALAWLHREVNRQSAGA